jgi:uncharacterized protein with NRDE domain
MRKKRALHKGFHVLTVRFLDKEWRHFQAVQAQMAEKERRHVTYNEIIVGQVMELPRRG